MGRQIDKFVFNPNVSIEEMTDYLDGLPYNKDLNGVNCLTALVVSADEDMRYSRVYAINFNAFSDMMGTSGYGIAVIEDGILKQAIFTTDWSDANKQLVSSITDESYKPALENATIGWSDTNDYVLTGNHSIAYVYDDKVGDFIGVEDNFWE